MRFQLQCLYSSASEQDGHEPHFDASVRLGQLGPQVFWGQPGISATPPPTVTYSDIVPRGIPALLPPLSGCLLEEAG